MLTEDSTPEEAKEYGKRRALELVEAIEAVIKAHSGFPEVQALHRALMHIKDPFLRVLSNQEAQRFHALTEVLADLEHQQWAHWTKYMLKVLHPALPFVYDGQKGQSEAGRAMIRWMRQIDTPYADLSEEEKESDREWARKVLEALEGEPIEQGLPANHERINNLRSMALEEFQNMLNHQRSIFDTLAGLVSPMADAVELKKRHDEAITILKSLTSVTDSDEEQDAAWDRARSLLQGDANLSKS